MLRHQIKRLSRYLLPKALDQIACKYPGVVITRDDGKPYLQRSYIRPERDEAISPFLHQFLSSDPLNMVHNHPWQWGLSIILHGGYVETRCRAEALERDVKGKIQRVKLVDKQTKVLLPGSINFLSRDDLHRVEIFEPTWTLFFAGPRISTWGFAKEEGGEFTEVLRRTKDFIKEGVVPTADSNDEL